MVSRLRRAVIGLLLLAFAGCQWDLTQALRHPSIEDRMAENLSGALPVPDSISVNPDSFQFAVLTDLHFGAPESSELGWFAQEVRRRGIDFVLVLGDLTDNGFAAEFARARAWLDQLGIPYRTTVGNHDFYQSYGWDSYKARFGRSCGSFVVGGRVKVILLDTGEGVIGATQFRWLEQQLLEDGAIKVVGTHFPLYDGELPVVWRMASSTERYRFQSLLGRHRVHSCVAGHIHGWRHTTIDGVNHFIAGTMAPGKLDYGTAGYLLFRFAGDSLTWSYCCSGSDLKH